MIVSRVVSVLAGMLAASAAAVAEVDCIACEVDAKAARQQYNTEQWAALMRGDIVSTNAVVAAAGASADPSHQDVGTALVIRHRVDDVWSVLTDFTSRSHFMPGVKEVKIVRTDGNRIWLAEELKVWWMSIRYNFVSVVERPQGRISWTIDKSVPNDIADSTGAWQLIPLEGGNDTLVQYQARIDTGRPLPTFVENFLVRSSLPEIVSSVRGEVDRRFPQLQRGANARQ